MSKQGRFTLRAAVATTVGAMLGALVLPVLTAGVAAADTAPTTTDPVTISADALPTVQVNGVVWAQAVVGSTVYATGEFTSARPAGAASGVNETPRSNLLAYNLDTGDLVTSWAPTLNAQGRTITASADGSTIYVGGDFTTVNGVARNRIVALNASTGEILKSFAGSLNGNARALAVSGSTLYVGGGFTTSGGQTRTRLAAFDTSTGQLLAWAPTADALVEAITVLPTVGKVVVGGRFAKLNSTTMYGMGALDAATGATLSWPVNTVAKNSGDNAAITSLSTDGTQVYATGYTFGSGGNLESYVATDLSGNLVWVSGCRGDTYDAVPLGGVLYSVSHAHDCSSIGGHPQSDPWTYQRAMAVTTAVGGTNVSGTFSGKPAPKILQWLPTLSAGSYTGQVQAAWSVAGNAKYVVLGGEFPSVNGSAQQGLVRMAVREIAPDKQGPQTAAELTPTATSTAAGTVTLSWKSDWDRDNALLSYQVLRGDTVVGQVSGNSTWWNRPALAFTDRTAPGGTSQSYRIRARDAYGNTVTSSAVTISVTAGTAAFSGYADAVTSAGVTDYWRLSETSGTTAADPVGGRPLTLSGATRNVTGALTGDADKAATFSGADTVPATTKTSVAAPGTFSEQVWFKTDTSKGGKLIGFGNSSTGASSTSDRHLYLANDGKLYFGVLSSAGTKATINSTASYTNNAWHQAVATFAPASGAKLYVDGALVASSASMNSSQSYTGYWRVAGDSLSTGNLFNASNWPAKPTNTSVAATLDEPAVYTSELSAATIGQQYAAGQGKVVNRAPAARLSYTAAYRTVTFDASASTDVDGSIASYSWNFGDGSTGTGATPAHTYATTGSFPVTVTVTDNSGATSTASLLAATSTPLNSSPTAVFSSAVTGLDVAVNAAASADPDGSIASYGWNFGDGGTGTGVTAGHSYAKPGSYQVTLTVTDAAGSSSASTSSVTVAAPGNGGTRTVVAADAFARTVSAGLGTAGTGGAWSVGNTATTSVADGSARFSTAAGRSVTARLGSVSSLETDLTTTAWTDAMPTGGGVYLAAAARSTVAGDYRARVKIAADGTVSAGVTISSGTSETAIGAQGAVAGLTYAAGDRLTIRTQVSGSSPTTIRVKVWKSGGTEPADWTRTVTDSTAGYQVAGGVALYTYNSGSATATMLGRFDDLTATAGLIAANQPPVAAFSSSSNALAASFDAAGSADADGSIAAYAWSFGDGDSGAGVAPSHTYAAAGSYSVKLTVTDNAGASTSVSKDVAVSAAAPVDVVAADTFTRSVAAGFGTAHTGGAWTTSGATSTFSVADGSASVVTPIGGTSTARLDGVSRLDTDMTTRVWVAALPTGGGVYYSTLLRRDAGGDYRAKVRITATGTVQMQLAKVVGGTEAALTTAQTISGLTVAPGSALKVRAAATGTAPTTLSVKVWADGSAEPGAWQQTVTDSTEGMQDAGVVGLVAYLSGSATASVVGHYDDMVVR